MKQRLPSILFRVPFALIVSILAAVQLPAQPKLVTYASEIINTFHIGSQSSLTLEGATNVNHFLCACTQTFPVQKFYVEKLNDEYCTNVFRQTRLMLNVKSLDCGNKMMNKDMYEALNAAEFPQISIELVQVAEERCDLLGEEMNWVKFIAQTQITLNGETKEYQMNVIARKTGPNQFRFITDKTLAMSDFGIIPPTAALGMVKVKDEIKISLDMWLTIQ